MAQTAMTVRMDNQQKAQFDKLCEQFGMSANTAINIFVKAVIRSKSIVSIRSTPYCISQKNIVPLHGGIIFLILRQEYAI